MWLSGDSGGNVVVQCANANANVASKQEVKTVAWLWFLTFNWRQTALSFQVWRAGSVTPGGELRPTPPPLPLPSPTHLPPPLFQLPFLPFPPLPPFWSCRVTPAATSLCANANANVAKSPRSEVSLPSLPPLVESGHLCFLYSKIIVVIHVFIYYLTF